MTDHATPMPLPVSCDSEVELISRVKSQLSEQGYVHVAALEEARFLRLAEALGPIVGRVDVRVEPGQSLLSSAASLPFHTDGPEAKVVGWWCAEPAERDGENLLIDAAGLMSHLDGVDIDELTSTQIRVPAAGGTSGTHPCVFLRGGRQQIYYVPWHLLPFYDQGQRRALSALHAYLRSQRPCVTRLRRDEGLFIDNGRVLHGRAALAADSRRHLRRVWIG